MVRFENISTLEKNYPFVKAVAKDKYKNGLFGEVKANGVFEVGANATQVIMQVESGHYADTDEFTVKKDEPIRVADLTKVPNGTPLNITKDELPSVVAVGNKLVSKADGTLKVDATATTYIEVTEVTSFGANGKVVIGA